MDITGEGDSIAILTVLQAIKQVLKQHFEKLTGLQAKYLTHIHFEAERGAWSHDSRISLYRRMIKRFAPKYGFVLKATKEYYAGEIGFHLVRNQIESQLNSSETALFNQSYPLKWKGLPGPGRVLHRRFSRRKMATEVLFNFW